MAAYLDLDGFKTRTVMPSEDVDYIESKAPGYVLARLAVNSSRINARLGKRYTPFASPAPEIVLGWLTALTTVDAYEKRGWDPTSAENARIVESQQTALAELKEAADGEDGLFDLPLREDTTASGVNKGGPLVYSEPGPYEWADLQREAARGR